MNPINIVKHTYYTTDQREEFDTKEQAEKAAVDFMFDRLLDGIEVDSVPVYACYLEKRFDDNGLLYEATKQERLNIITSDFAFAAYTDHTSWELYLWNKVNQFDYLTVRDENQIRAWVSNLKNLGKIDEDDANNLISDMRLTMMFPAFVSGTFEKGNTVTVAYEGQLITRTVHQKRIDSEPFVVIDKTVYFKKELITES